MTRRRTYRMFRPSWQEVLAFFLLFLSCVIYSQIVDGQEIDSGGWHTVRRDPGLVETGIWSGPSTVFGAASCGQYGCGPPQYSQPAQSMPPAYTQPRLQSIPGMQGPPGPAGPPGLDATVNYEWLLEQLAGDERFRGNAGPAGPPGPRVAEVDYDALAARLRLVLAPELEELIAQQVAANPALRGPPGQQGPTGPPGPTASTMTTEELDEIARRVRQQITGSIRYEVVPKKR